MNKCSLAKELNSCPDFVEGGICAKPLPHSCSMLERGDKRSMPDDIDKPRTRNIYIRKERWYEKYYKGGK